MMKLCSFSVDDYQSFGVATPEGVVDLKPRLSDRGCEDLKQLLTHDLIEHCQAMIRADSSMGASVDYAYNTIQYLPVIPNPGKILCVGINYHEHKIETGNPDYVYPMFFTRYPESQVGHLQPMLKPRESNKLDYEGELAVIIGKAGRRIRQSDALNHVAGYACYNDGSVRDYQRHTTQFLPGKNFVGTGAFGPWMVTADEIPDPSALHLTTRLNGQLVQSTDTSLMINSIPTIIEYISTCMPLKPGDVIVTGTPGGVGSRRSPPLYMFAGDTVEVEISEIGVLKNQVAND